MNTYMAKNETIEHQWFVVDATDKTLGRLATVVASVLKGKHKPTYTPHVDTGDYVIIIKAENIQLTGKKWDQKLYYKHSGYSGGLTSRTARETMDKFPTRMVEKAVQGMLPHTKLGRAQAKKLFVYAGSEHKHSAQQPKELEV